MVLQSTRWLSLSYFTYFFSYGIFLPFWGIWLQGEGIPPETIGILLGAGLISRFLGSLIIAPSVKDPSHLVTAIRILALLALAFAVGFWFACSGYCFAGGGIFVSFPIGVATNVFFPDAFTFRRDDLGHDVIEEGSIMADQENRAVVIFQQFFQ